MRSLIQFTKDGERGVAALDDAGQAFRLNDTHSTFALAQDAVAQGASLAALATARRGGGIDLASVTLHAPIDHADPAHLLVSGTGLTRSAVFTPAANQGSGTASITVVGNSYQDAAGNNGSAGGTPSLTIDTLAPTISAIALSGSTGILNTYLNDGDTANVTVTPPAAGKGYLLVESAEGPLWWQEIEVPAEGKSFAVKLDPKWARHDLYVSALVIRPGERKANITPKRAVGLLHLHQPLVALPHAPRPQDAQQALGWHGGLQPGQRRCAQAHQRLPQRQRAARLHGIGQGPHHLPGQLRFVQQRLQQVALVPEVPIHRATRHTSAVGHLLHGAVRPAALRKKLRGRLQNALAGGLRLFLRSAGHGGVRYRVDALPDQPPPSALYSVTPLVSWASRVPMRVWRALYQERWASSTSR